MTLERNPKGYVVLRDSTPQEVSQASKVVGTYTRGMRDGTIIAEVDPLDVGAVRVRRIRPRFESVHLADDFTVEHCICSAHEWVAQAAEYAQLGWRRQVGAP